MGGGTGTGASPIIADLSREAGALTISVVTRPFTFEGKKRARQAEDGIMELSECTDAQIVIPNQRLIDVVERKTPIRTAFRMADEVLLFGVKSISDLITVSGEINVDFADVKTIMKDAGVALMGIGVASGDERAKIAAQNSISCPLLEEVSIEGATGVLVNVMGPPDMLLHELDDAMGIIYETVNEDAEVIFGLVYDEQLGSDFQVTVIATGFNGEVEPIKGTEALDIEDFVSKNFIRRDVRQERPSKKQERRQRRTYTQPQSQENSSDEDSLDIPTFLRIRSDK
jgi:cell division protein FtsZ